MHPEVPREGRPHNGDRAGRLGEPKRQPRGLRLGEHLEGQRADAPLRHGPCVAARSSTPENAPALPHEARGRRRAPARARFEPHQPGRRRSTPSQSKMKQMAEEKSRRPLRHVPLATTRAFEKLGLPVRAPGGGRAPSAAWGEHSTVRPAPRARMLPPGRATSPRRPYQGDCPRRCRASRPPDLLQLEARGACGACDPGGGSGSGHVPYYMKLAQERGCKTIVIDPALQRQSPRLLADQWIPIRPGTDLAIDAGRGPGALRGGPRSTTSSWTQWVEPGGLRGVARLLSWARARTASRRRPNGPPRSARVPAETIREFARLYGTTKPVHLQYFYSCAKRHMGDYSAVGVHAPAGHDRQHRLRRRLPDGRLPAHARPRARPRAPTSGATRATTRCRCSSTTTA